MLTLTPLSGIPNIQPGDTLAEIIMRALEADNITLQDDDILVLAQKVVSKAEGRRFYLPDVNVSQAAHVLANETGKDPYLVQLILDESNEVLRSRPGLIIVEHKLGFVCANAGIDHSNVDGGEDWVLLLPENPDESAHQIRQAIQEAAGARVGVLVIDSHGRAWRNGTLGLTIGLSGVPALVDKRGEKDMYGREMQVTIIGAADELAAAASLMMGQVAEGTPVVHARGFPYALRESSLNELLRSSESDMFR